MFSGMVYRKFICLFFALAISISLASAIEVNLSSSSSILPDTANLVVSSLRYEPYPVEPGEVFDLWIKIENDGAQQAKNAACRLILDNPFSLYQGDLIQTWGLLGSRDQAVFKYKLRVSDNAAEGDNELKLECAEDSGAGTWKQTSLMIKIQSRYPTLNIVNVETEPSAITPGHKADLIILLENMADSSMKDINIKIDFTSVPFAPYQEIGEKKLRMLESGKNESLVFSIVALPSAEGGIYKVPVEITYTDNVGTSQSIDAVISLEINSKPDLYITADSSELTKSMRTGTLNLKVTNKGLTNIKFMDIKLLQSKQIKIISSDTAYVGDVDSDDSETAEFKITAKSSKLVIPIEMSYRDVNNNLYTEQVNVTYNLLSAAEAGKGGINWPVIIIVLLAIIFVFIKRKPIFGWIKSKF
jgi:hypothetical protein